MAAIKSRDTKPELFIRKALFADGFRYRIAPKNIPGCPDVYLPKYKVAIFIHGCFWHRHRDCRYAYMPKSRVEFWQKKFDSNTKRDLEVRFQLREAGIRVIVIWECAIRMVCKTSDGTKELIHHIEAWLAWKTCHEYVVIWYIACINLCDISFRRFSKVSCICLLTIFIPFA